MSDDIVTRLRNEVVKAEIDDALTSWELAKTVWEAATEIERLRHERLEWFLAARQLRDVILEQGDAQPALDDYLRVRGRLEDPRDSVAQETE